MENQKDIIKLSKRALEQRIVEKVNKEIRELRKDDNHPGWLKDIEFRWCEYDDIDGTITLRGILTEIRGKKGGCRYDIELEKDLSEGFGEENNNYFVSLYEDKGESWESRYDFKAELQEDFKEFLKNERRERSE